ncbi:MAG: chorismate synthase [Pseudomonadota bacterium]
MSGNIFGNNVKIISFGESHGKAVGVLILGLRPGIEISIADIQKQLNRRKPGQNKITSPRSEDDKIEILSGVFNGLSLGTPICAIIKNKDVKSQDYDNLKNVFRPGHADYTYFMKYGIYDHRGGGRASGRETAARVIAGSIAQKILKKSKIKIYAFTEQVGNIKAKKIDLLEIDKNPVKCPDKDKAKEMETYIKEISSQDDSCGGIVKAIIENCPGGLGDPVFGKLDAEISKALMSIGSVKGVEIGAGFSAAKMHGSKFNDQMNQEGFLSNNSGGILGGISNGNNIEIRIAVKPTPSILKKQKTINNLNEEKELKIKGRHDPCICPRIVPVVEAMLALVILDKMLSQEMLFFDTEADDLKKISVLRNKIDLIDSDILYLISERNKLSSEIGILKKKNSLKIYNQTRELEISKRNKKISRALKLDYYEVENVMGKIIDWSKKVQK